MGSLRWNPNPRDNGISGSPLTLPARSKDSGPSVQFIEDREKDLSQSSPYLPVPASVPDAELPFIDPSVVTKTESLGLHWIVINNIIYDCTDFINEHPGGQQVLKPFKGTDCTWQFFRFHGEKELKEDGQALRVGQTKCIKNKYKEQPRFVGLRPLGVDDW